MRAAGTAGGKEVEKAGRFCTGGDEPRPIQEVGDEWGVTQQTTTTAQEAGSAVVEAERDTALGATDLIVVPGWVKRALKRGENSHR